ncbi:ClpP family protease [Clostridium sulfidigenes]|uniref:ClpP family protease n=1 Tax=Clostridium sulfidigenes TaxID=318464 RepID=UPI0009FD9CE2|nr:ATP-dependent Clp protease proteolytic subunit [Clostridium sulfidigenes]HAR85588.1 Clp protease [Clostridium sp.]HBA02562.1 Clp protease [Clostridium sp.]HCO73726.1 Clp protease [Clostridium sp.]
MINEAENKKHKEDKDTKHKKNNKSKVIINEENDDEQNEDDNSKGVSKEVANLKEVGVMSVAKADDRIQVIPIIGQVEGHNISGNQTKSTKYELIIPQLIAIERDSNVKGILIVLNTAGGDVEAGLAIAEMITSLSKPTVSIVIGGGHSIGVPLATASDYSFITPSATMIVHPVRMNGFVIGVPQTFEYFRKMQERIVEFVVRTSKIDSDDFRRLMSQTDELLNDIGTILIGDQAVECGLIDEVGGIREALDKLEELISEGEKNQLEISSEENISEEIDKI